MPKPAWQEPLEQAAHFLWAMSFAAVFADRLFFWWREFIDQAPIERPEDTQRDLFWMAAGGTVGGALRTAGLLWWLL